MRRDEFGIGRLFYTATGPWYCTDIGTRTVCAIPAGEWEVTRWRAGELSTYRSSDPGWLVGPPYPLQEQVFTKEEDWEGCSLAPLEEESPSVPEPSGGE